MTTKTVYSTEITLPSRAVVEITMTTDMSKPGDYELAHATIFIGGDRVYHTNKSVINGGTYGGEPKIKETIDQLMENLLTGLKNRAETLNHKIEKRKSGEQKFKEAVDEAVNSEFRGELATYAHQVNNKKGKLKDLKDNA